MGDEVKDWMALKSRQIRSRLCDGFQDSPLLDWRRMMFELAFMGSYVAVHQGLYNLRSG